MATFPASPRSALLIWSQAHAPIWALNGTAIGLSISQTGAYSAAVTAYASAALAQEQARQAAKVTTEQASAAFTTLASLTGNYVRTIRAFAELAAKPDGVYNLAQIPPPAQPTPMAPPGQPVELAAVLDASSGALALSWKSNNPVGATGTSYLIKRRLAGEAAFTFVGVSGVKKFTDTSLTAGPDSVQYTVQGQRADAGGPVSPVFTVNFGRLPGGALGIVSQDGGQSRAAA